MQIPVGLKAEQGLEESMLIWIRTQAATAVMKRAIGFMFPPKRRLAAGFSALP